MSVDLRYSTNNYSLLVKEIKTLINDINKAVETEEIDNVSLDSFEKRAKILGNKVYLESQKEDAVEDMIIVLREQMKTVRFQLSSIKKNYMKEKKEKLFGIICNTNTNESEIDYLTNLRHIRYFLETEVDRSTASIKAFKNSTNVLRNTIDTHQNISSLLETGKDRLKSFFRSLSIDERAVFVASMIYFFVLIFVFLKHFGAFKFMRILLWGVRWLLKDDDKVKKIKVEPELEPIEEIEEVIADRNITATTG